MLRHREKFFEAGAAKSILYVNCNMHNTKENPFENYEDELPPISVYNLSEIEDVSAVVRKKQIVILDDVVHLSDPILYMVTYAANHHDLIVFVVNQGCISNKMFELVYKVHSIIMLFRNSSSANLANHLLAHFFISKEKKNYLKKIFGRAEQLKTSVVLKLNAVASSSYAYKKILAFADIEQLFVKEKPHCLVFPEPEEIDEIKELSEKMNFGSNVANDDFVLVQAKHVKRSESGVDGEKELKGQACSKKSEWDLMYQTVVDEIQSTFPPKRWNSIINVFKEVLRVKQFCISQDFRTLLIRNSKKNRVSIIDFLTLATRRSHPNESREKFLPYLPFVKLLIKNGIPSTFLKNQKLTEIAGQKNGPRTLSAKSTKQDKNRKEQWRHMQF